MKKHEKKRVSIICGSMRNSLIIKEQLNSILGEYINFECIDIENSSDSFLGSNLILTSGNKATRIVANSLMDNSEILIMGRTIRKENYEKLLQVRDGVKILVVNEDQEMTEATISLLYELGLKSNELIPYFPGCDYSKGTIRLAITPNEVRLVPDDINEIINIGTRVIDPTTIFDILIKLELINNRTIKIVNDYVKDTILLNPSLGYLLRNLNYNSIDYERVLNNINTGIIIYNKNKKVIFYNKEIQKIYKINNLNIYNYEILDGLIKDINLNKDINYATHRIKGKMFLISNQIFRNSMDIEDGGMLNIIEFRSLESMVYSIRNIKFNKLHNAKHTFVDIIGNSDEINKSKELAYNFAKFELPVLIQGESGTGKELFAQSIHNASLKKDGPFVAFNCAALSDSLIESELFGYEEGAFTGAKKEGKVGIFELANGGTIFLDEIGDLQHNLQAKLLRVLQEGEIMRVGGTEIIPINVRIISSTNKDLIKLVEENKFRADLYYRLNVLPLHVEPFRNRREDIKSLFDYFYYKNNINKDISKSVMDILLDYDWPGNGREIRNFVEYISTINKNSISVDDIPKNLMEKVGNNKNKKDFAEVNEYEPWVYILMILRNAKASGKKLGRKNISKELNRNSIFKTEAEVRVLLQMLSDKEMVKSSRGRGGTNITDKGLEYLQSMGI